MTALESEIKKQSLVIESKIASEIENHIKIGLESAFEKHSLRLESKIASEIEKQNQVLSNRLFSLIEKSSTPFFSN